MATIKPYISSMYLDTRGRTAPHKGVDTAFGVYAQGDGVVVAARSDIPKRIRDWGLHTLNWVTT